MTICNAHRDAVQSGKPGYIDPQSGLFVMTESYLRSRGRCCGNGCRHCPFGRSRPEEEFHEQNELILPPDMDCLPEDCVTLFWSGGKDSYLAYLKLAETEANILLCTTYANGMVGHQEIPVENIAAQAKYLNRPLLLIALKNDETYEHRVSNALEELNVERLAFGDLHLEEIKDWRVRFFSRYTLLLPIWKVPYPELLKVLWQAEGVPIVSAVGDHVDPSIDIQVGEEFNLEFIEKIQPYNIDIMGENGEFHTEITFASSQHCTQ